MTEQRPARRAAPLLFAMVCALVGFGLLATGASAAVIIPRPHAPEVEVRIEPVRPVEVDVPVTRGPTNDLTDTEVQRLRDVSQDVVDAENEKLEELRRDAGEELERMARTCLVAAFKKTAVDQVKFVAAGQQLDVDQTLKDALGGCFSAELAAQGVPLPAAKQAGDDVAELFGNEATAGESAASHGTNGNVYADWLSLTAAKQAAEPVSQTTPNSDETADGVGATEETESSDVSSASVQAGSSSPSPGLIAVAILVFGGAGLVLLLRRQARKKRN